MANYFLKTEQCKLYSPRVRVDEYGNHINDYDFIGIVWCYTKQLSASVEFTAAQFGKKEKRLFVLNALPSISVDWLIVWKNQSWKITRCEQDGGECFCYVALSPRQEVE